MCKIAQIILQTIVVITFASLTLGASDLAGAVKYGACLLSFAIIYSKED